MIAIKDLDFEYPEFRALSGITATVPDHSITALVGPNGAGKTTLIRCIAALSRPFGGQVEIDGLDVHRQPRESHRLMGYLADFFGVYADLTVRQCLHHRAAAQGLVADEQGEAVTWAATRLGVHDRMDQQAGTLSRGLRQRLAIAQAIVHKPKVLLLDEPASGLDPEARIELGLLIRDLGRAGMTVIVSSHILAELADYSTHMMILRDGALVDFQPLQTTGPGDRVEMLIRLAEPVQAAETAIQTALEDATAILRIDGDEFSFCLPAPRARDAAVLQALIAAGLPVVACGPRTRDLQDSYLKSLHGAAVRS